MNYAFNLPLLRNGYHYLHEKTINEIEQDNNCTFSQYCEQHNIQIAGTLKALQLTKITKTNNYATQPTELPAPAEQLPIQSRPVRFRARTRKRFNFPISPILQNQHR